MELVTDLKQVASRIQRIAVADIDVEVFGPASPISGMSGEERSRSNISNSLRTACELVEMASPPTAWELSVSARPILRNPSSPLAAENHRVAIVNTSMAGRPAYSHHEIKPEIVMKRFMKLDLPIIVSKRVASYSCPVRR